MNAWFGEPWPHAELRAPVCEDDRYRVPTPVGQRCLMCDEDVQLGDRGTMTGFMKADGTGGVAPLHAECSLRSVLGNWTHVSGRCHHTGECNDIDQRPYRQQALEVWEHIQAGGIR